MTLLLWLAKFLGLKGMKRLSVGNVKWTIRLALLLGLLWLALFVWYRAKDAWSYEAVQKGAWALAALALAFGVFRWRRKRQGNTDAGERTIDGKTVPDKLAAAAIAIPSRSPDAGYVLRGLPHFGKTLLKLPLADFEYEPEPPEELPPSPVLQPATATARRSWLFGSMKPSTVAVGVAALLVVVAIDAYKVHRENSLRAWQARFMGSLEKNESNASAPQIKTGGGSEQAQASIVQPAPEPTRGEANPRMGKLVSEPDTVQAAGLTWTANDNGQPVDWVQAEKYCATLSLAGRKDWRLPKRQELSDLWAEKKEPASLHLVHEFRLSESTPVLWSAEIAKQSSSKDDEDQMYAWSVNDEKSHSLSFKASTKVDDLRALCVSDSRF